MGTSSALVTRSQLRSALARLVSERIYIQKSTLTCQSEKRGCYPALYRKLLLQTWIRGCDEQSRSSALRHTDDCAQSFTTPSASLASRLHAFATNLHEIMWANAAAEPYFIC